MTTRASVHLRVMPSTAYEPEGVASQARNRSRSKTARRRWLAQPSTRSRLIVRSTATAPPDLVQGLDRHVIHEHQRAPRVGRRSPGTMRTIGMSPSRSGRGRTSALILAVGRLQPDQQDAGRLDALGHGLNPGNRGDHSTGPAAEPLTGIAMQVHNQYLRI
jgi:hypothetical protein